MWHTEDIRRPDRKAEFTCARVAASSAGAGLLAPSRLGGADPAAALPLDRALPAPLLVGARAACRTEKHSQPRDC